MMDINVLLVDDHQLFRVALKQLITSFRRRLNVIDASSGYEALEILQARKIDLMLLDIQMPVLSGIDVMKKIKHHADKPKVIVLTQFDERSLVAYMLELGANAFLKKNISSEELEHAIYEVIDKCYYFDDKTRAIIEQKVWDNLNFRNLDITQREMDIISLLMKGDNSKEISIKLGLTVRTVESYRKSIMKKTKCKSVTEMISLAYRTGMAMTQV
jgi:DNA-binding NarL/FixJ family response regulator